MAELTSEEKQKIYEEEKIKIEAQERLKKQKASKNFGIGCLTIIIIFIVLVIVGANSNSNTDNTDNTDVSSDSIYKPNLEIIETSSKGDTYNWYVTGTVKNNSTTKTYGYVQVEVNLYDNSGAQVGSTMDNTNNLEPGGIWKFKAIVIEDAAKKYKVKGVSGW